MMKNTREDYLKDILTLAEKNKALMLSLPTGTGKSKISLELCFFWKCKKLLIVVPKLVLFQNWKEELDKWGFDDSQVQFTTYVSLYKYIDTKWDCIIFDEGHHFTERCVETMEVAQYDSIIFMSATFPKHIRWRIKDFIPSIKEYSLSTRKVIDDKVLPDPKILLVPLLLDNTKPNRVYIKGASKAGKPILLPYKDRWNARLYPNRPVHIQCTEQEWYEYCNSMCNWWKEQYTTGHKDFQRNNWLRQCKTRLEFLSDIKSKYIERILLLTKDNRTLTFCSTIEQTEKLSKYCINSKNKESKQNLKDFNEGKINHITACGVLNEGVNLSSCQIGIFAAISSSEIVTKQRNGRLLRHPNPLFIIPYYIGTREEELVDKMKESYNPDLIITKFPTQFTFNTIKEILNETP